MATQAVVYSNTPLAILASMPITVAATSNTQAPTAPKAVSAAQANTLIAMAITVRTTRTGVNSDRVSSLYQRVVDELAQLQASGQILSESAVRLLRAETASKNMIRQIASLDARIEVRLIKVDQAKRLSQNAELMFYAYRLEQINTQAAAIESSINRKTMLAATSDADKFQVTVAAWHNLNKQMNSALKIGTPVTPHDLELFSNESCDLLTRLNNIGVMIKRALLVEAVKKSSPRRSTRSNTNPASADVAA
jgi:hypothetical protein